MAMDMRTQLKKQLSVIGEINHNSSIDDSARIDLSTRSETPGETVNNYNEMMRANGINVANNNRHSTAGKEEAYDSITANESKGVNALKSVMYLTLLFSAGTVALATAWFVQDERLRLLELELEAIAGRAISDVQAYLDGISTQLYQVSMSYTSEYQASLSDASALSSFWVNLTLPHFDQRIKDHPTSELIFYAPIIPASSDVFLNQWTNYSMQNQDWIDEALAERGWDAVTTQIPETLYSFPSDGFEATTTESTFDNILNQEVAAPIWQVSPVPRNRSIVNLDVMTIPVLSNLRQIAFSPTESVASMSATFDHHYFHNFIDHDELAEESEIPASFLTMPVYKTFDRTGSPFGYMFGLVSWHHAISEAFQESYLDISVNFQEQCGNNHTMTFLIQNGGLTQYLMPDDPPPTLLDSNMKEEFDMMFEGCDYKVTIHPLEGAEHSITREVPILGFVIAACLLVFLVAIFFWYNRLVKERQLKLLSTAKRSNAVVSSLFPEAVQNRLMQEVVDQNPDARRQLKEDILGEKVNGDAGADKRGKAIADFFPETTIMFADIVGFTAWSSMREPTQVFELLESIYGAFDEVARKRRVFKVETIGDCYVAVVGLPDPCEDHAIVMARFAHDCRVKMNEIVKQLEVTLGPDTADLCMRIGLHSGPVTAGVLRGDKARFQLFGDTMNTTSRIETTGAANRVHISEQTAAYLMDAGKKHWLSLRADKVTAKGKGELTTYWLRIARAKRGQRNSLASQASAASAGDEGAPVDLQSPTAEKQDGLSEKEKRLVDWITNELMGLLARVALKRDTLHTYPDPQATLEQLEQQSLRNLIAKMPLNEAVDTINFPVFDADLIEFMMMSKRGNGYALDEAVKSELHDYIHAIASMYIGNQFHNFEHASHVTMSVVKLLSRIVAPGSEADVNDNAMELHKSTFGIASDPLAQFTIALSALIHDVDHPGVPNAQLLNENAALSGRYKKQSMAEQNSVDKSWRLLMDAKFANLRRTIYQTESEYQRFRQVLVNAVMATDIVDKTLVEKRKERWELVFKAEQTEEPAVLMNRRATVVIEHIIQASDIAHTMQHWHVYRKWNGRLFEEMYKAFESKRAKSNPVDNWYDGEIAFFDFYIIPLAKKLKDCGVFGVSSDELLNYAQQNRQEWALTGKRVVSTMVKAMQLETDGPIRGVSRYKSNDSMGSMLLSPPGGSKRGSGASALRNGSGGAALRGRKAAAGPSALSSALSHMSPPATGSNRVAGGSMRSASRSPPPRSAIGNVKLPFGTTAASPTRGVARGISASSGDITISSSVHSETARRKFLLPNSSFSLSLDDDDDVSHHSELTNDSYARLGKDMNLPPELNVLIVDDDNLNRRLFIRAVMSLAPTWIVSESESIDEAVDIVEKSVDSFDVIFMDLHAGNEIGDLSGKEAVKLLREKGVDSLICGMSVRDAEDIDGDATDRPLPFQPKALLKELNNIMTQSSEFDW